MYILEQSKDKELFSVVYEGKYITYIIYFIIK